MAENSINPKTKTSINPNSSALEINVEFNDVPFNNSNQELVLLTDPKVSEVELMEEANYKNNVYALEGELMANVDKDVFLFVDIDGDIHVSDSQSDQYEIDSNGDLIFSYIE